MAANFKACDGDTHHVSLHVGGMTAAEIVRDVVDAIARNTERTDRHECLHVAFKVRNFDEGYKAARAAARRIRDLYRGPYERVIFTETI